MARPVGGRVSEAFKDAYAKAGLKQTEVEAGLHERGFTNVDQPLVSKWLRGVRPIPIEVLPALDEIVGKHRGYLLEEAGYVEYRGPDVRAAVMADPQLDEIMRNTLLAVYDGMLRAASEAAARPSAIAPRDRAKPASAVATD